MASTRKQGHGPGTCSDHVLVGFGARTSGVRGITCDDPLIFSIKGR